MDTTLATHQFKPSHSSKKICKYCRELGHILLDCPTRHCRSCQKIGVGHYEKDCPIKGKQLVPKDAPFKSNPLSAAAANNSSSAQANIEQSPFSTSITVSDLKSLLQQLLQKSGNTSISASSTSSGNSSWYFDSACYNHMTPNSTIFTSKSTVSNSPAIHTANGSSLPISHDPKTRQTLGIGRKVGHLFELVNLHISYHLSHTHQFLAPISKVSSTNLWHSHLGLLSLSRLQSLVSSGQLGLFSELQTSALENVTPSSELPILPHRSSPTNCNSSDSIHYPPLRRSTRVRKLLLKFRDYKCFSATLSLYD
ncbi:hypothetical protein WN944_006356 [Citrus x changshan-huyou]|uniref:CCHC-type domain-containing protein n=1 Tax=Citrus x changshan-huyou TaxID=2935761 RepID=A0AAP0QT58_9ROSI